MTPIDLIGLGMVIALIPQLIGLIFLWQIWRKDDDDSWDS